MWSKLTSYFVVDDEGPNKDGFSPEVVWPKVNGLACFAGDGEAPNKGVFSVFVLEAEAPKPN